MRLPERKVVWKTARRTFEIEGRPLLMAVINATPDSFSDGGSFHGMEAAIAGAEKALDEGADIIDVGGESTRPGSQRVSEDEENSRVLPIVEDLARRFTAPISVDTSKSGVARRAIDAGAEIVNDISGFRFDPGLPAVIAERSAGVVIMHSRGSFEEMHSLDPVVNVIESVINGLSEAVELASDAGIEADRICMDVGIGFGKSFEQNLELIRKLELVRGSFEDRPMLVGVSRKSFIGTLLKGAGVRDRLYGTLAANAAALFGGADILRVHDVKAHRDLIEVLYGISG